MGVSFLCVFDLKVAVFFPKIGVLGVVPLSVCRKVHLRDLSGHKTSRHAMA